MRSAISERWDASRRASFGGTLSGVTYCCVSCLLGLSCIFRGVIRRVLSKPDPDDLICASALLVGDVMEDTVVRVAGVSAYDSPRPQVPGEHGVEFRSVEADFGQ